MESCVTAVRWRFHRKLRSVPNWQSFCKSTIWRRSGFFDTTPRGAESAFEHRSCLLLVQLRNWQRKPSRVFGVLYFSNYGLREIAPCLRIVGFPAHTLLERKVASCNYGRIALWCNRSGKLSGVKTKQVEASSAESQSQFLKTLHKSAAHFQSPRHSRS